MFAECTTWAAVIYTSDEPITDEQWDNGDVTWLNVCEACFSHHINFPNTIAYPWFYWEQSAFGSGDCGLIAQSSLIT